jgi:hypothetical protein
MKTKIVVRCSLLALTLGGAIIGCGGGGTNPTPDPDPREDADASSDAAPATPAMPEAFDAGTTK